jgi:hypothetical protein
MWKSMLPQHFYINEFDTILAITENTAALAKDGFI